jgi:Protein of unknown function (DUF4043)
MPNYPSISGDTVATIVAAAGANSQEQAWAANVAVNALRSSRFVNLIGGAGSGKPIMNIVDTQKIAGDTVHLQVEAPLGGPGYQGSGATRTGNGESTKFALYDFRVGVMWKGVKWNNVAKNQTTIGKGNLDVRSRGKLSDWFKRQQADNWEAEMLKRAHARNTIYSGRKTSVDALVSADTFQADDAKRISNALSTIMAKPMNLARKGMQELKKYYIILPHKQLEDLESSNDWQTLLANSDLRGSENSLFTGLLPSWGGAVLDRWQVENDTADGPQGSFCAPVGYLGEAIGALPVTGATLKLGGSATAAAKTTPLYAQYFANAAFGGFEGDKIAADTSTEATGDAGKFGFYAYQVNDGNRITLTKALRSTNATSGKIDLTTVGSVTWNSGVWTTTYLTDQHAIGSEVIPCNAKGQPFVRGYALAQEAIACGYGKGSQGLAFGTRTQEEQNHGLDAEIGMEMCWGARATQDANALVNGYGIIVSAWNPEGLPVIV